MSGETSALELGIDVGSLNASVLLGYPGAIAKTWQMLGRAGRTGDGLLLFVGGPGYLDEYWLAHADELVGERAEPEDVVVYQDNVEIVREHVRAAARDCVIDEKRDAEFFGPSFNDALSELKEDALEGLRRDDDVWVIREAGSQRAFELSLRGLGQYKVPVHVGRYSEDARPLYEEESHRAPRRLFNGAVFLWEHEYFKARELVIPEIDPRSRKRAKVYAVVDRLDRPDYLTVPKVSEETTILMSLSEPSPAGGWGRVEVTSRVEGYFKSADAVNEIEGANSSSARSYYVPFGENRPPDRKIRSQGAWFQLPPGLADGVLEEDTRASAINTVAEALARAVPLLRFGSPGDLSASVRENAAGFESPDPVIFLNESVVGGAGIAARAFERRRDLVAMALRLLSDCRYCARPRAKSNGCPRCVALSDGSQDRKSAMALLKSWGEAMDGAKPKAPRRKSPGAVLRDLGFEDAVPMDRGGMGQIWRAERDGRTVAIKLLLPKSSRRTGGARTKTGDSLLRQEAERLRVLDHKNIVELLDVHETERGLALELEWVDGFTLDGYLDEAPTIPARVALWKKIVSAVAYLHENDVVHRDLKPANILVRNSGEPIIVDFGIAKDLSRERATTVAFGTDGWAAPEQFQSDRVAATMDVYALGQLLRFLVTGKEPWRKGKLPKLPGKNLAKILERCRSKDPTKRFPSAVELAAVLRLKRSQRKR